jgi:hypothetical protein
MFLSAKGLLGRVTKLKRSSGRIKPQPGVVFDYGERELNIWGVGVVGSVWKERKKKTFTIVRSGESVERLTWEALRTSRCQRSLMQRYEKGQKLKRRSPKGDLHHRS